MLKKSTGQRIAGNQTRKSPTWGRVATKQGQNLVLRRRTSQKPTHRPLYNARTKEAELKLEQLRRDLGPRQFLRDPFIKEVTGQPSARVEVMYLQDDPECFGLAQQIWQALENGKWPVEVPKPIPPLLIANFPTAMSVGGQPSGVTVVAGGITQAEADAQMNALQGKEWIKTPWTVLMHALGEALGKIGGSAGGVSPPPQGWLRVVVSPRI
jgi:hypothetical protein